MLWIKNNRKMEIGCVLWFLKKCKLGITKNYRYITLTAMDANFYNGTLFIGIQQKVEKNPWKNQNSFRRNSETASQILLIRWIIEGIRTKNLETTQLLVQFFKAFDSICNGKMKQKLLAYDISKELVKVCSIEIWRPWFAHRIMALNALTLSLEFGKEIY